MRYFGRLQKAQDEVIEIFKDYIFEKNNSETKEKILKDITKCFKENEIIEEDKLEDSGWEVSFYDHKGRFNDISITLKNSFELTYIIKGGEK